MWTQRTKTERTHATFQAINSGNGLATGVDMTISGEPSDKCKVSSTTVYVNEPIMSNPLGVGGNHYTIGIMEPNKRYVFAFQVEADKDSELKGGKFVIEITSKNQPINRFPISVPS